MMQFFKPFTSILTGMLFCLVTLASVADECPRKFLQALRENGYGDMAVEYLKLLAARPQPPSDIAQVWDLEMGRSLLSAAAVDAENYDRLVQQARNHLEKYLREHPEHPDASAAANELAELLVNEALHRIRSAKLVSDDAQSRAALYAEAREYLSQARNQMEQVQTRLQRRLAEAPQAGKSSGREPPGAEADARAALEAALQETRLRLALLDYHLAQTYDKADQPKREELLRRAAVAFDEVFQRDRQSSGLSVAGLYAHLWHGKVAEEMGDLQLAMDIYEEVLAAAPEPNQHGANTELEPLFAQVEYFRLSLLAKQKPDKFLAEAEAWLKQFRRLRKTDGYQGITLEAARALQTQAGGLAGAEKNKRLTEALQLASEAAKNRSAFQHEAILLRRELLAALGRNADDTATLDEVLSLADAAALSGRWAEACNAYQKALHLAEQTKGVGEARLEAIQEALANAKLMLVRGLFNQGKFRECLAGTEEIIFADSRKKTVRRQSQVAAQAASLAVAAALQLYGAAKKDQKPAALQQVLQAAELVETHWPDRPEADEARLACAQALLFAGRYRETAATLERIRPTSERYPTAMYLAAQSYARLYLLEKGEPAEKRDSQQLEADRRAAIERLQKALSSESESTALSPAYRFDAMLLLAELYVEGNEQDQAARLYRELLKSLKTEVPPKLNAGMLRMFLGAVRTFCLVGQIDEAAAAANTLLAVGRDEAGVNAVLIECAKLLDAKRRQALTEIAEPKNASRDHASQTTQTRLQEVEKRLADFLLRLAERKELSPPGVVFVADCLNAVGKSAEAAQQYQRLLQLAESRADVSPQLVTRTRAQLIGLLRKQGKYAEAAEQVERLIKANPLALEPQMEKGRILQAWAEVEPAKAADVLNHWLMLRGKLQNLRPKPPEYFEAVFHSAECLVREAERSRDAATAKERARQAEQVLKATLVLYPQLSGPDAVAQYKQLLEKAQRLQEERSPAVTPQQKGSKP